MINTPQPKAMAAWRRWITRLVQIFALLVLLILLRLPREWITKPNGSGAGGIETLTQLNPAILPGLERASLGFSVVLIGMYWAQKRRGQRGESRLSLGLACASLVLTGMHELGSNVLAKMGNYCSKTGELELTPGNRYMLFERGPGMAREYLLGVEKTKRTTHTTLEVVGKTRGGLYAPWSSVIRSAETNRVEGGLYLAPGNILVGVAEPNRAVLAYRLNPPVLFDFDAMYALSPFLLLDANQEPSQEDFARVRERIQKYETKGGAGYPYRSEVWNGLKHPNPLVREMAKQLLELLDGKTFPPAPDTGTGVPVN